VKQSSQHLGLNVRQPLLIQHCQETKELPLEDARFMIIKMKEKRLQHKLVHVVCKSNQIRQREAKRSHEITETYINTRFHMIE